MGKLFKEYRTIIIILALSVFVVGALPLFAGKTIYVKVPTPIQTPSVTLAPQARSLTYQGAAGKDALTILKEKAKIEQDKSGLVVSINGRKADNAKHEYWAFYVNNTMAEVGPADYQTKDTDTISWKIEKY